MQMHTAAGGAEVFPPKVKEPHVLQEANGGLGPSCPGDLHTATVQSWASGPQAVRGNTPKFIIKLYYGGTRAE